MTTVLIGNFFKDEKEDKILSRQTQKKNYTCPSDFFLKGTLALLQKKKKQFESLVPRVK